jgi:cell division septation protein DedD
LEPAEPRPPEDIFPSISHGNGVEPEPKPEAPEEEEERLAAVETYPEPPGFEKPPEKAPEAAPEKTDEIRAKMAEAAYAVTSSLQADSYYLQLGVYSKADSANTVVNRFASTYPVTVYRTADTVDSLYKVMIGPLNEDESGSLLYNFKAQGYRDAFIRKGK